MLSSDLGLPRAREKFIFLLLPFLLIPVLFPYLLLQREADCVGTGERGGLGPPRRREPSRAGMTSADPEGVLRPGPVRRSGIAAARDRHLAFPEVKRGGCG